MDNKAAVQIAYFISSKLRDKGVDVWLDYGSALGAVRDGGIPESDDDIDMGVWLKDWKAIEELFSKPAPFPCRVKFIGCYSGGFFLTIKEPEGAKPFKVDVLPFDINDNHGWLSGDGIRSAPCCYQRAFRSKAYYQKNLKTIQFEGKEFLVSKYVEKYLDYIYEDTGGDWRTTFVGPEEISKMNWEGGLKSYNYKDKITGCTEGVFDLFHIGHVRLFRKMRDIFDRVVVSVNSDELTTSFKKSPPIISFEDRVEIIKSCKYVDDVIPYPFQKYPIAKEAETKYIKWMEANNIDYMIHGKGDENWLKTWYSEPMKESRLLLLDETKDYHSKDIKERIKNVSV